MLIHEGELLQPDSRRGIRYSQSRLSFTTYHKKVNVVMIHMSVDNQLCRHFLDQERFASQKSIRGVISWVVRSQTGRLLVIFCMLQVHSVLFIYFTINYITETDVFQSFSHCVT